ncbi:MAG: hypothetical protein KOO66_13185 [Bacteroidales bacterium]|nr:hypothetical protein [Bacteroidales bacterium]
MHPVHVSVTNMEYQPEKDNISLSFKIFTDDFQILFSHLYNIKIDFNENGNYSLYQEVIDNYFAEHFKVLFKDKELVLKNTGIKSNFEATWFFYDCAVSEIEGNLIVKNTLLLDLYPDQKNLLIFKNGKLEKGYQFNIKNNEYIIISDEF